MDQALQRALLDIAEVTQYDPDTYLELFGRGNSNGPVMIGDYVTVASLLETTVAFDLGAIELMDVLKNDLGLTIEDASQLLYNTLTGEFAVVEGFDGHFTKGSILDLSGGKDDGRLFAGGSGTTNVLASGDQRIDGSINGDQWSSTSISYAFSLTAGAYDYAGTGNEDLPGNFNDVISAQQEAAAHFALSSMQGSAAQAGFSVEGFTNLDINFLGNVDSATAEIRFAETSDPGLSTARVADFPGSDISTSTNDDGDVWFGTSSNFRIAEAGNYQWHTMLHEIGHALGLKHGHLTYNYGALPANVDSNEFSLMTYRSFIGASTSGGATNETWGFPQTFMMLDIATLQYMYGADFTANAGNTVYSWTPGSGDTMINGVVAISPGGNRIFATIWDGDGIDTYDLSAYITDLEIDLSPGGHSVFSSVQIARLGTGEFSRGNIFNALQYQGDVRSLIENAIGGSGNDSISGNAANNILTGNTGDDIFFGSAGDDTLNGGAGVDTASYADATQAITLDLGSGIASGTEINTDTLMSIENAQTGAGNDTLTGSSVANELRGGDGADMIMGLGGNDTLFGEVGDDILDGGDGNDTLYGGNDLGFSGVVMGSGQIVRNVGAGNDSIANALNIDDEYSLDPDADIQEATTRAHVSITATGDETVHYYEITVYGSDSLLTLDIDFGETSGAGSFNSRLELFDASGNSLASNELYPFIAGAGGSTSSTDAYINYTVLTPGLYYIAVSAVGGAAIPTGGTYELQVSLDDNSVNDTDTGDDTLTGGIGDDILNGGAGSDYAVFSSVLANYTVTDIGGGVYTVTDNVGTDGVDTLSFIEFLRFADGDFDITTLAPAGGPVFTEGDDTENGTSGDDVLDALGGIDIVHGLGGNDTIYGGAGDDQLFGDDGNDDLYGGLGADVLDGGAGHDRAFYSQAAAGLRADMLNSATNTGEAAGDSYSSIEALYGSIHNDILSADHSGVDLVGLAGNDQLIGRNGRDRLFGGDGNDRLDGGRGNDDLHGNAGIDTFVIRVGAGKDRIFTYEQGIDIIEFGGGPGSFSDLSITVIGGNTVITHFNGVTSLIGFTGTLTAADFVFLTPLPSPSGNNVTTNLTAGNDNVSFGIDNDTVNGLAGNDIIRGGIGDDILNGGDGNDQLFGGLGADHLDGGAGIDRASYTTASSGVTVNLINPALNTGEAAGDTYSSIENIFGTIYDDILIGDAGDNDLQGLGDDDQLIGADGDDRLFGGDGDDRLTGGRGDDDLFGGAGSDTFVFGANSGTDRIFGFEDGLDIIQFQSGPTQFSDLTITFDGADSLITWTNRSIELIGFDATALTDADFLF